MKKGIATFTLDYGKCPRWLFERMVKLGRELTRILVAEYGPDEYVKRLADPVWFQALGTVLAFDWNASGLTTILTAALKEAIRGQEQDLGVFICGGKGKTSRKTPDEITNWGERLTLPAPHINNLVYNSRMSAKVDSSLVQDGYQIYHHSFIFSRNGVWTVVQQGMNIQSQTARRYHWFSEKITDLVVEPHSGIAAQIPAATVLNLTAKTSGETRDLSVELVSDGLNTLLKDLQLLRKYQTPQSRMLSLGNREEQLTLLELTDKEFTKHPVLTEDFAGSKYLQKILTQLNEQKPKTYEQLVSTRGVGPKTIRALALVAEIIYGAKPSYQDPARYSFAHGGKDEIPYPIDKQTYDKTIALLTDAVEKSHFSPSEKDKILKSKCFKP